MTEVSITETIEDRYRRAMQQRGLPMDMTPEEIETWVDSNIVDLASAKNAIKRLAVAQAATQRILAHFLAGRR